MPETIAIRNALSGRIMRVRVVRAGRRRRAIARNMHAAGWPLAAIAKALAVPPTRAATLIRPAADLWREMVAEASAHVVKGVGVAPFISNSGGL